MVLSSQISRSSGGRRRLTSRHRKPRLWRWGLLILILIGAGTYWFWTDTETPAAASAEARGTLPAPGRTLTPPPKRTRQVLRSQTSPKNTTPTTASPAQSPPALTAKNKHSIHPSRPKLERSQASVASLSTIKPAIQNPAIQPARPSRFGAVQTNPSGLITRTTQLINNDQWVDARSLLNTRLIDPKPSLSRAEARSIREKLAQVNATLVFSSRVVPNDPLTELYTIASGDFLAKVAPRYSITYQLIEHINGISARRIRVGQRIKLIHGPFHAVVTKSDFRMDLFLTDPDGKKVYIRSLPVGLGEDDSTPLGSWIVRPGGKVANPGWTNPRTGKVYAPDNPLNPIGEYWIGLEGNDDRTRGLAGYGIHGTIDSDSIGKQVSMGCVRLLPDDIALVYKLLVHARSTVVIQP